MRNSMLTKIISTRVILTKHRRSQKVSRHDEHSMGGSIYWPLVSYIGNPIIFIILCRIYIFFQWLFLPLKFHTKKPLKLKCQYHSQPKNMKCSGRERAPLLPPTWQGCIHGGDGVQGGARYPPPLGVFEKISAEFKTVTRRYKIV